MYYAQFLHYSSGYVPGTIPPRFDDAYRVLIEACGSGAFMPLDGRLSKANMGVVARAECLRRGYAGYSIYSGPNIREARKVSGPWPVPSRPAPVNLHAEAHA